MPHCWCSRDAAHTCIWLQYHLAGFLHHLEIGHHRRLHHVTEAYALLNTVLFIQNDVARETWSGKLDFLLSCIGYAVGLGNVWRFPYLCYRNGGGAFLVPYVIMLIICGMPIFFFELGLGQFASEGPITVWKVNPLFYGIGWGMVLVSGMVCIYYNVIIMYSMYYMFVSFVNLDGDVPWVGCNNTWNTPNCRQEAYPDFDAIEHDYDKIIAAESMKDSDCMDRMFNNISASMNPVPATLHNISYDVFANNFTECDLKLVTPSEEYWSRYVLRLNEADGIGDIGGISLKNIICLFFAWILIFFCLMKGIKSSGKVVYFTATFPYVILVVLLIRGLTLPGYKDGIEFYITPDWSRLSNAKVWADAATQIFYSLGPGFGGLLTMASFNNFKNNCWRDSIIVSLINCGTSVFAGFAIFSLLGFMAHQTNQAVSDVADSGPGLAFVAYPEGIARLPVSSLWAFLFFFMLVTLGLDSQFVMMETVISGATDVWPRALRKRKTIFTLIACIVGFVLGIPMTCKGGIYVLTLFDWYCASYGLMLIALFELIAVCWMYGIRKFIKDLEMMIGPKPWFFWIYYVVTWCVVSPVAIVFIIIMSGVHYTPASYNDYVFPAFAEGLGWMMVVLPVVLIITGFVVQLLRNRGDIRAAASPKRSWGPRLAVDRTGPYNDNLGYVPDGDEINELKAPYTIGPDMGANGQYPVQHPQFEKL